jgi:IS30 family transposase
VAKRRGPRGSYRLLTPPERAAIEARFRCGALVKEVMAEFCLPHTSACHIQDEAALTRRRVLYSPHRLSFEERERIFVGVCRGESDSEIARALGRHRPSIGREIRRGGERRQYRPLRAERVARWLARRPKPTKLSCSPRLVSAVQEGKSAIATLVERQTRYMLLARLGHDRTTAHVVEALKACIAELPAHLLKSLTWDQGQGLAAHKRFSSDTGIQVYFCDPHPPWQRGSNENTNGLLRQYLPRELDLATRSQVELDQIAAELNGRPRETLEWRTPAEKMEALLR